MKYLLLVGDGMADYPVKELQERTPLEAARTPHMDRIVQQGVLGRVKTIPARMNPASDVATISILGYDPSVYYSGRGPLEAANMGIELGPDDVAFRCNLVTVLGDTLVDYSAGHISTEEASKIIHSVDEALGTSSFRFYPGVGYRHLMVARNGALAGLHEIKCMPPHDITGKSVSKNLPKSEHAREIVAVMRDSQRVLETHEINQVRVDLKENPANMIWLWGQGRTPVMPLFKERFGVTGSVISAVDLLKGLGKILGLEVINVPGATGYYDTDYEGKARAALHALEENDFVFVHVEAPDEAGHNGDLREKITAIERFDQLVVGTILEAFGQRNDFRVLVLPDHATPVAVRTHTAEPVCFAMCGAGVAHNGFAAFNEKEAALSKEYVDKGHTLMERFIGKDHG
jgi:2,3-bisphosphoglycerate-independent phosphoglycerate mutase